MWCAGLRSAALAVSSSERQLARLESAANGEAGAARAAAALAARLLLHLEGARTASAPAGLTAPAAAALLLQCAEEVCEELDAAGAVVECVRAMLVHLLDGEAHTESLLSGVERCAEVLRARRSSVACAAAVLSVLDTVCKTLRDPAPVSPHVCPQRRPRSPSIMTVLDAVEGLAMRQPGAVTQLAATSARATWEGCRAHLLAHSHNPCKSLPRPRMHPYTS